MTNTQNEELKNLEELIEKRKQEAKDKQIGYKLRTIVDNLGHKYTNNSTKNLGSEGIYTESIIGEYKDNNFSINYKTTTSESSDGGGGFYFHEDITYDKSQVYSEINGEIRTYIPGIWENEYNQLYDNALNKKEENEKKELQRQQNIKQKEETEIYQQLKKNFGL